MKHIFFRTLNLYYVDFFSQYLANVCRHFHSKLLLYLKIRFGIKIILVLNLHKKLFLNVNKLYSIL